MKRISRKAGFRCGCALPHPFTGCKIVSSFRGYGRGDALMIGQILGNYRIEQELGAGGMGVVYQATDSKLGRQVAIKVLPMEFAKHPERLARFEREARLLASLNHPN